jgi:hypothetical protein
MNQEEARDKAFQYGPVFAQKVDKEWILADQIASVDFTGGGLKKCSENIELFRTLDPNDRETTKPVIYYSVCETTTHYFIFYSVYHVFDWWKRLNPDNLYDLIRNSLDEHIHDMEGGMLVVTKSSKDRDEWVDGVVTMAHRHFYLYTEQYFPPQKNVKPRRRKNSLFISKFNETIDGNIWLDRATKRIKLYIEAKGHGLYGDHKRWGGGDEIWYYTPTGETQDPRGENVKNIEFIDNLQEHYKKGDKEAGVWKSYELEDICGPGGLWDNRHNDEVFRQHKNGAWGFVYKNEKSTKKELIAGAANPPWSMNDSNDKSPLGEIFTDPAHFILRYGQGWGPVSTHYHYNPYFGIE